MSFGLIGGDSLGLSVAVGLLGALLGAGISAWTAPASTPSGSMTRRQTAAMCLGAAAAVATMLTALHAAGRADPYWATATEHAGTAVSATLLALVAAGRSRRLGLPRRTQLPILALVAGVGTGGDLAYAAAAQHGALSIISGISSLYPLTTIGLGRLLRAQRATRVQLGGMTLALLGAALLAAATH